MLSNTQLQCCDIELYITERVPGSRSHVRVTSAAGRHGDGNMASSSLPAFY